MKKYLYAYLLLAFSTLAIPALAAVTTFKQLINDVFINGLLKPIIPLLIGLAVVVFVYGVLVTMFSEGGDRKEEGKQYMVWGIVGIFVMISVWGLVNILVGAFNLSTEPPVIKITP